MAKQTTRRGTDPSTGPSNPSAEVRHINEEYRVCCLNKKYYGRKLYIFRHAATTLDVVVALSATLAALPLFKDEYR
jgi:hypothetical protein